MTDTPTTHPAYTARILVVALVLPLILTGIALVIGFSLASQLPASIVVHWDLAGKPNGYGSPYSLPITVAVVCVPLAAIFGGAVILISHRGPLTPLAKILAVTSTWLVIVVSVLLIGELLYPGIGSNPGLILTLAFVGATVVGAALWLVLPPGVRGVGGDTRPLPAPVALAAGERASWIRTTTASRGFIWTVVGTCVLLGVAMALVILSSAGRYWPLTFVPVVVLLILLSNFAWTVRVDARGVFVRSVIGIPVIRIPLGQVTSADVIDVQALSQYGGWGIRWALNGRLGIIVRSGEALEVHRAKGLDLVVTVDDASTAAALLNGLVERGSTTGA
jgi:Protein of unknown function (DUF1648)